jgi:hypothetical protein
LYQARRDEGDDILPEEHNQPANLEIEQDMQYLGFPPEDQGENDSDDRYCPHKDGDSIGNRGSDVHHHRGIGTGNQKIDIAMVQYPAKPFPISVRKKMIEGGGTIEQKHSETPDEHTHLERSTGNRRKLEKDRKQGDESKNRSYPMGNCIFLLCLRVVVVMKGYMCFKPSIETLHC